MKINQYEFFRDGKPFEPTRQEIIRFVEHEFALKDRRIAVLEKALEKACEVIKEIMPNKPLYICGGAIAERLGISITSEIKDYEYFIEQAEEELEDESK